VQQFITFVIMIVMLTFGVAAKSFATPNVSEITCKGRFVNPISDICWSCIMPISIGAINVGEGSVPRKRDTDNPSSPICGCIKNNIPIPGISVGFWEPLRLVDITRTPYCMVNLGGILMGSDSKRISDFSDDRGGRGNQSSFYHLHYYVYPLIYWLEILTDFACLEVSSFDGAYMSEFDITWNDPKLQSLFNPEAILFGNPLAQSARGSGRAYCQNAERPAIDLVCRRSSDGAGKQYYRRYP
jgi:conjugal transfer pilus assembly protein TraU